jgi:hypothetical protein
MVVSDWQETSPFARDKKCHSTPECHTVVSGNLRILSGYFL